MHGFERAYVAFIALALGCGGGGESLGSVSAAIGDAASETAVSETKVIELSSDSNEIAPATDEDDLLMAFASDIAGGTAQDIYFSARPDKSSPWSPPVLVPSINSAANDWDAFLGDHRLQIFFNSDRGGMAGDLYLAVRSSPTATFGPVVPLAELNSPANDTDPTLSRDLRYIMFGSNRSGNPEIYEAYR